MPTRTSDAERQRIIEDIGRLLERHRVLDALARRQASDRRDVIEDLQHRQNAADVQRRVKLLHPADLAFVLESLPVADRRLIWRDLDDTQAADALLELDTAVRDGLLGATPTRRLVDILRRLDPHDLGWLSESIPPAVLQQVVGDLDDAERLLVRQTASYDEGSVGYLMTHDLAVVQESATAAEVVADLRSRDGLPRHADPLFVVDRRNVFSGALSLQALLLAVPSAPVADLTDRAAISFAPDDAASTAARAFERYNLVSAAVITDRGKLVGRLTIDAVVDFIQQTADRDALAMAGLSKSEDLFAPVWHSARNRSMWLLVNLVTAFLATRFIGLFESTIGELVALASLMPIVASVGGNTGNQTVALVIRGLAFDQIGSMSVRHVLRKEFLVGLLNGVLWGGLVGLAVLLWYRHLRLGIVLMTAVILNLAIAAVVGVAVPLLLHRYGRDPAQGASVLLTFVTDSMGFLLFLGLAQLLL
ncbi:MAG: magnesium transporter [Vicinamibacterales bacterium]